MRRAALQGGPLPARDGRQQAREGRSGRPSRAGGQAASMAPWMFSTMVAQAAAGSVAAPETMSACVVPKNVQTEFISGSAGIGTQTSPAEANQATIGRSARASAAAVSAGDRKSGV